MDLSKLGITPEPWELVEVGNNNKKAISHDFESLLTISYEDNIPFATVFKDEDAQLKAAAPDMLQDMIWFVLRCEKGEVRSKRTYAKFKATIEKACYPKTWEEIKELIC